MGATSAHPTGLKTAPKTVTGSVCDHIAKRGPASPLCSAVSASWIRGIISPRNCAVSLIGPPRCRPGGDPDGGAAAPGGTRSGGLVVRDSERPRAEVEFGRGGEEEGHHVV